jgi:hypothetical protein
MTLSGTVCLSFGAQVVRDRSRDETGTEGEAHRPREQGRAPKRVTKRAVAAVSKKVVERPIANAWSDMRPATRPSPGSRPNAFAAGLLTGLGEDGTRQAADSSNDWRVTAALAVPRTAVAVEVGSSELRGVEGPRGRPSGARREEVRPETARRKRNGSERLLLLERPLSGFEERPLNGHARRNLLSGSAGAAGSGQSQPTEGHGDQPQDQRPSASDHSVAGAGTTVGDSQYQPAIAHGD